MRVFFDREFVCFHIQRFGHDQIYNTQKNKNYAQVFYPPSGLSFFNWKRERDSGHKSSPAHNSRFPEPLFGSGLTPGNSCTRNQTQTTCVTLSTALIFAS